MTTTKLLLLGALATLAATPAAAFVCTRAGSLGPSVAWADRAVVVAPGDSGGAEVELAPFHAALARSAAAWTDVDCSDASVTLAAPTGDRLVGFDWAAGLGSPRNQNIVVWKNDDPDDPLDRWLHTFGALAITTVTYESSSGELLDADVEINDASFPFTACDPGPGCTVRFDLENTLTHELGHVLGLDHPIDDAPGAFEATMYASAPEGDIGKRDLANDDIGGLCTIYPTGEPAGECTGTPRGEPPEVVFSETVCAAGGNAAPLCAGLLLLGWLRWRRRSGLKSMRATARPTIR